MANQRLVPTRNERFTPRRFEGAINVQRRGMDASSGRTEQITTANHHDGGSIRYVPVLTWIWYLDGIDNFQNCANILVPC